MSDDTPDRETAEAEPTPPKRRKKRRAEPPPAESTDPRASAHEPEPHAMASGPETPAFAAGFPRDPTLDALVAAFEAGDYARVRREAPALAKQTDRDDVRAAARELARRLEPDPLAGYLLGMAALLLAFLAGWYWLHAHGP